MQFNILDRNGKKRVTSQRIYSLINKGPLFLVSNSLRDFMAWLEIEGYISKRGKEKSASYFVRNKFIVAALLKRM